MAKWVYVVFEADPVNFQCRSRNAFIEAEDERGASTITRTKLRQPGLGEMIGEVLFEIGGFPEGAAVLTADSPDVEQPASEFPF